MNTVQKITRLFNALEADVLFQKEVKRAFVELVDSELKKVFPNKREGVEAVERIAIKNILNQSDSLLQMRAFVRKTYPGFSLPTDFSVKNLAYLRYREKLL